MIDEISHPELVADRDLQTLRNLTLTWGTENAPKFATWLHSWIDAEQALRATGSERDQEHLLSRPGDLDGWSDRDLAQALGMCTSLHFSGNQTESVGRLIDRWLVIVAHAASNRLHEHAAK